ncbi:armadillo-type protein [Suillus fuscotomentosus]|uniref:Armadillo-type protein n=1 Tax=Suillus fuscotomentosus TaxID=1912939 RepID=A0AAD4EDH6_9AGAM|nr:armadillo-type protein [Suillus fuscotomentosus]KAG1904253.1 armadillo-type protein [Suillus fuscotomentosus]
MEEALAKIRPHTTSNLAHQKAPANLLQALESTFQEKHADRTPTAYFAALITTLDGSIQKKDTSLGDGDVLPAELYLLALVAPFVPPPVIQTNLNTLLSLTAPLFPALMAHAPPMRSQLTLYNAVFRALDKSQLDVSAVRQSFASILQLCLDPRPKVRKKAADIVKDVLSFPPSPLIRHPYAQRVAEWAHIALQQASTGALPKSKSSGKGSDTSAAETAIHLLAFLRPVLPNLPLEAIPPITTTLLTLPRLGNPYLSQAAYSILSDLFTASTTTGTASAIEQIPAVLHAVLESPPAKADNSISPSWIRVLGDAMFAYHVADASACATEFHRVWKTVWSYFETKNPQTRKAVAESLDLLTRCITSSLVRDSISDGEAGKSPLRSIISQTTKALDSLSFASAMQELLSVISALVSNLSVRVDPAKSTTATEALLMPLVSKIANLRVQKGFEHKEAADAVLSTAMRVVGPAVLLEAIPLNLEPSDRQAGKEPRAFLLPMLNQPHPSLLGHFVSYFVPMSERMFNLQQKADSEGRQSEAKVWSVLVTQIWSGFAGYCHAPSDIKTALTPAFSQILSQLLYSQPDLRPPVLRGLKALIESNKTIAAQVDTDMGESSGSDNVITPEQASENLTFLKTQVESWFAVFFNVFGSVDRDNRGMVGDVIGVWAGLAEKQDIAKAYRKVVDLFRQSLQQSDNGNTTAMMQDLLILLLPFLDTQDVAALFSTCLAQEVLCHKDNGVQKRGYKILAKLLEHGKVEEDALQTFQRLDELSVGLSPAAKKDRFILLSLLILGVPSESLHIIPSLIPEAVLGTKEPSEKARLAAFELIVAMGQKMSHGGVVKRSMVDGMDEDGAEAQASINEYMTMVAGGLAGASPHMISATVTAVSRLVFEFRESIDTQMQTEVFTTLLVFLSSANREIIKSTLGYIKLAIHTLPIELLRPHLKDLVPALLAWSHDHKNHFKAKVRHIFERMIRRFGWNDVYQAAGEDQAAKVLVNIKKRKERAKRKKAREDDDEEEGEATKGKVPTGDAFEDVLYGSESELDDSDEDEQASRPIAGPKRKGVEQGVRLRVDDDEPMDLLQGVASRLTNAQANRRRKPGQDAGHFKTDTDTGKIVINEDEESDIEVSSRKAAKDVAGSAYRESMTSVDGFTRGPNGRIKFNKDTKKRRRENEDEDGDVEMADGATTTPKKHKRPAEPKFGHEFKAKKAGGDVKKGGVDPYAYVSLSQAAKKKGRNRTGIAGKHR